VQGEAGRGERREKGKWGPKKRMVKRNRGSAGIVKRGTWAVMEAGMGGGGKNVIYQVGRKGAGGFLGGTWCQWGVGDRMGGNSVIVLKGLWLARTQGVFGCVTFLKNPGGL